MAKKETRSVTTLPVSFYPLPSAPPEDQAYSDPGGGRPQWLRTAAIAPESQTLLILKSRRRDEG